MREVKVRVDGGRFEPAKPDVEKDWLTGAHRFP